LWQLSWQINDEEPRISVARIHEAPVRELKLVLVAALCGLVITANLRMDKWMTWCKINPAHEIDLKIRNCTRKDDEGIYNNVAGDQVCL
jgi:hypothetical protein